MLHDHAEGAKRRARPPYNKAVPPSVTWSSSTTSEGGFSLRLWLHPKPEASSYVDVLSAGRRVMRLPCEIPGVQGWVEGPFEVDTRFQKAKMPAPVLRDIDDQAVQLLERERDDQPWNTQERFKLHIQDTTIAQWLASKPLLSRVPMFRDLKGDWVTWDFIASQRRLKVWWIEAEHEADASEELAFPDAPVLRLDAAGRFLLKVTRHQMKLEHIDAWREAREAKRKQQLERKAEQKRVRVTRQLKDRANRYLKNKGIKAPTSTIQSVWERAGRPSDKISEATYERLSLCVILMSLEPDDVIGKLKAITQTAKRLRDT